MGDSRDDHEQDSNRPLYDKTLQSLNDDADRFVKELQDQEQRFHRDLGGLFGEGALSSFKKFIDGSVNTLSESWRKLPSNIVEFHDRMQQEQRRMLDEELDISRTWNGSNDTPDHITMEVVRSSKQEKEDARSATALLLTEALRRNENVPGEKIEALYNDPEDTLGQLDRLAEPFFGMRLERPAKQPWLSVDWFKRNPYSPIRLEAHPDMAIEGPKWRAAFEDLLDATLEKPMGSMERVGLREPYGKPQSTYYGPGLEWLLSLQCRGILPPLLPRFYKAASEHSKRALGKQTLTDIIRRSRSEMPWSDRLSPFDVSLLRKDVSDLLTEVATKSTCETEADPMPLRSSRPQTEQDLYDSPHMFPRVSAAGAEPTPVTAPTRSALPLPMVDKDDWEKADYGMWRALHAQDSATVARILNNWYYMYGDIGDLVHEPLDEFMRRHAFESHSQWFSTLNEAIRRTDLPDDDFWKQNALSKETEMLEKLDKAPSLEKWRRRQLMRRGDELVGYTLTWPLCSTEQLEEMVDRMEQENEYLGETTGGNEYAAQESAESSYESEAERVDDYQRQLLELERKAKQALIDARREQEREEDSEESDKSSYESEAERVDDYQRQLLELERKTKQALLDARREQEREEDSEESDKSRVELERLPAEVEKPQVLSALTTTQTTRLPDGTVTTKVVLKRRFADGREETEESLHTSNESRVEPPKQQVGAETPKQKGWFWS